jgi:hypothetical protein
MEGRRAARWSATLLAALGAALAAACLAIPWILRAAATYAPALAEAPYEGRVHLVLAVLFAAGTVYAVAAAWRWRPMPAMAGLAVMMVLVAGVALGWILPLAHEYAQGSLQRLVVEARSLLGPADALIQYGFNAPSVVFYAGRRVIKVERGDREGLRRAVASVPRAAILARLRDGKDLAPDGPPGLLPLAQGGGFGLYLQGLWP